MKKNIWPLLLAIIGISFLAITGWSLFRAASGVSSVTDPGYYSHGLKYNATSIEIQAAASRGWTITPVLTHTSLKIHLTDASGSGITDGTGSIAFLDHSSLASSATRSLAFTELKDGWYTMELPKNLPLSLTADIILSTDQATIQRRMLLNIPQHKDAAPEKT